MELEENVLNLRFPRLDDLVHLLARLLISYKVGNTYRESIINKELLNGILHRIDEIHGVLAPIILEDRMNNALTRLAEDILVDNTLLDLALADNNIVLLLLLCSLRILLETVAHLKIDRRKKL